MYSCDVTKFTLYPRRKVLLHINKSSSVDRFNFFNKTKRKAIQEDDQKVIEKL